MVNLERYRSVNAVSPKQGVSDKYSFVSTTDCLKTFQDKGWVPVSVSEKRSNKVENCGFQKHLIRLRQNNNVQSGKFNEGVIPEIVLINSHDTGNSFQIMAGMLRMACANGLIVADNLFETQRIVHVGYAAEKVECAIDLVERSFSVIAEKIKEYQTITVSDEDQVQFANEACFLRWEEGKFPRFDALLHVRRAEDSEQTLWNLFNVVQENMLQGVRGRTYFGGLRTLVRGTKNIDLHVKINKGLWALTEEFARNKVQEQMV